ncbi:MAG: hypothetical protein ABIT82_06670 [Ramlibacter sp.]
MTRIPCRILATGVFLTVMSGVLSGGAAAQPAGALPTCMSLLTSDKLAKVMGATFKDMGNERDASGATDCEWSLRGGTAAVKYLSVSFFDSTKIKASPAGLTDDSYFEAVVAGAEKAGSSKREMLSGVGVKSAFVATAPQVQVVVQRRDGVARIIGNNVTKSEITALAKAIAAP